MHALNKCNAFLLIIYDYISLHFYEKLCSVSSSAFPDLAFTHFPIQN
jgi:hypothetical protein